MCTYAAAWSVREDVCVWVLSGRGTVVTRCHASSTTPRVFYACGVQIACAEPSIARTYEGLWYNTNVTPCRPLRPYEPSDARCVVSAALATDAGMTYLHINDQ